MHPIHTTPGFIVSSRPSGEAGKLLYVFTRDLGLILATAQGIRFEKSKLRAYIQDHSFGVFSFVRGKEFWRLTSAQEIGDTNKTDRKAKELTARVALLLERLLQGEEENAELFDSIQSDMSFVSAPADTALLDEEKWKTLESLIVIRILRKLGYIGDLKETGKRLDSTPIDMGMLEEFAPQRASLNQHINKALRESHL